MGVSKRIQWPCNVVLLNFVFKYHDRLIGRVGREFANGSVDIGSIPGRVIPKTLKMVLDTSLLNTQQYKVPIKGKVAPSPTPGCSSY